MTASVLKPHSMNSVDRASAYYEDLFPLCISGLARTHNPETGLFDRQLRDGQMDVTRGSEDFTSTCICLIGINRAQVEARLPSVNLHASLMSATSTARRRKHLRSIGLLIWANAVVGGEEYSALATRVGLKCDELFMSGLTTMELAWLLSGLLHEVKRTGSSGVRKIAEAAVQALMARFNPDAVLMRHAGTGGAWRDRVRRNIPNFADQIYTLQALSFAAMVLETEGALATATSLAGRLVDLQGPLGQWWWHYDAQHGAVAEPFPVYSVHQHAMAPMAFHALRAAQGPDYAIPIRLGQAWITDNEISQSLVSSQTGTVWRDVERRERPFSRILRKARYLLTVARQDVRSSLSTGLKINFETRPYEWAWCLYAGALDGRLETGNHIL